MCLVEFGQWLKNKREEKGWTQSQLAEESGVPQTTISGWETGKITNFRVDERLAMIAHVFSMRVCELPLEPKPDTIKVNEFTTTKHLETSSEKELAVG
ncbi:helix-turn-helix transcriptional regulator [Gracilibacillus dipsosauri]|uniref:helix-turn-helix transcriptional regulator n=1 Tax=Gracilibacillus dipsosauri TaxID=178340 RepID=UPI002409D1B2